MQKVLSKTTYAKFPTLTILIFLGLVLVNFIIQIGVDPSYKNMSTDSGTFAYCGQVIRNGGLMYRDCWDNKPPGVYYLNATAIWLSGSNPFAIWLFQAIWLTIAVLAYFLILNLIFEHKGLATLGSFTLLLVILYPGIFEGGNFTETYAVLPAVISLGAFWAYLRFGRKRWLIALGLLIAAGFLLKPTYIAVGLAASILVVYLEVRRRQYKSLVLNLAILCLSALVPLGLIGMYWVIKQDFSELWFAVFVHNISYLRQGFSVVSLYGTARMFLIQQPMAALTVLIGSSFVTFLFQHARRIFSVRLADRYDIDSFLPGHMDLQQVREWFYVGVFLAFLLDIMFLASSGKNFGHYLQVLLPGMVLGMLYLINFLRQSFQGDHLNRNLQVVALSAVLIVSLSGGLEIAAKELPNVQELKAFFSTPDLTVYQPTELEQYIINHSAPTDSVLIWAGHPGMNFVTHRRSPTRFIFLQHLFTPTPNGPNGFNEFLQELAADPPALIVAQPVSSAGLPYFANSSDSLCPNCDPLTLEGMLTFNQFVSSRYELSYSIWDWVVYQHIR
jgi:hypothetical protein